MNFRSTGRRSGRVRTVITASVLALTTVGSGVGIAYAYEGPGHAVPAPPTHPTRADQIQNIDQVKTAIKAYYGDQPDAVTVDPVTGTKDLHTFDPNGAYAHEMATS